MNEAITILRKAKEFLPEAELLYRKGFWNGATNRSYYAMFTAAKALLVLNDTMAKTHSGVHTKFSELLHEESILPLDLAKMLVRAFRYRQEADYDMEVEVDEKTATNIFNDALVFVEKIEKYIGTKNETES